MTAAFKNLTPSQVVPNGAVLQLTFGATHSWTDDAVFAEKFADVYSQLPNKAGLFTISRSSVTTGQTTTTVDATNHDGTRTAGEIVQAVETLCGYFVELRSIALLTAAQKAAATTPAGAAARDDAAKKEKDVSDANNPLSKFFAGLEDTAKKVVVVVVIVAVLVALVYAGKLKKELVG